jgi:hypothetical protein
LQLWRHGAGAGAASNPASTEDFKLGRCPRLRHGFSGDQQVAVTLVSERTIGPTKPALRDSLKRMGVRLLATGETREGAAGLDSVLEELARGMLGQGLFASHLPNVV